MTKISSTFNKLLLAAGIATAAVSASPVFAFNHYATQSVLATGKWVKISVEKNGVYQLTPEKLAEMGFSDPEKVHIYGAGGNELSEVLNGSQPDDLKEIPTQMLNGKLCFYGVGPSAISFNANGYFERNSINTYSEVGCYFLTENGKLPLRMAQDGLNSASSFASASNSFIAHTSYSYLEEEVTSTQGRDFIGVNFAKELERTFAMPTPGILTEDPIMARIVLDGKSDDDITVSLDDSNENTLSFISGSYKDGNATIRDRSNLVYTINNTLAKGYVEANDDTVNLHFSAESNSNVSKLHIDHITLSYARSNDLGDAAQSFMGMSATISDQKFVISDAEASVQVWNVTNAAIPTSFYMNRTDGASEFMPKASKTPQIYVEFDPTKELNEITSFEDVPCQNLHGMSTPELLIISTKSLRNKAELLAEVHRQRDGIDVAVVTQEEVFNEFSSGTPDATAYRLFTKMLYDRNPDKIRNLLMFGTGSSDNRQLKTTEKKDLLLTYHNTVSNDVYADFLSDDAFVTIADGASSLRSDKMLLGVGRITVHNAYEADDFITKVTQFYDDNDVEWRNNALFNGGSGDYNMHYRAAGEVRDIAAKAAGPGYNPMVLQSLSYPKSNGVYQSRYVLESKLNEGVLLMGYLGHGTSSVIEPGANLFTIESVKSHTYNHHPFICILSCIPAVYDCGEIGVGEAMVLKANGGAVTGILATRSTEANTAAMFYKEFVAQFYNQKLASRTFGEIITAAKNAVRNDNSYVNNLNYAVLGDPALVPLHPVNGCRVTKINDAEISDDSKPSVFPMQTNTVEGEIIDSEGNVMTSFNGKAYVNLYDKTSTFTCPTGYDTYILPTSGNFSYTEKVDEENGKTIYTIYNKFDYIPATLAKQEVEVVNGKFSTELTFSMNTMAHNEEGGKIIVTAMSNDGKSMYNGAETRFIIGDFNADEAVTDDEAPAITAAYVGSPEEFANSTTVVEGSNLHFVITDNVGISIQDNVLGKQNSMVLDGLTSLPLSGNLQVTDGGKQALVSYPLDGLTEGKHTVTLKIFDVAGNSASRSVEFNIIPVDVDQSLELENKVLGADDNLELHYTHNFNVTPELTIKVLDATDNVVWQTVTTDTDFSWDLKVNGTRLPKGVYRTYATVKAGTHSAGSKILRFVVVK